MTKMLGALIGSLQKFPKYKKENKTNGRGTEEEAVEEDSTNFNKY